MNLNDIVIFVTRVIYVTLSIVAIFDYARHRTPRQRDFALMASALGLPFGITLVRSFYPSDSPLLNFVGAYALFSQPYFLFRLLQYFRRSRRGAGSAILIGLVLSCVVIVYPIADNRPLTVTLIFAYCAIVEAYCTVGFYQGAQDTVGTLQRRLRIITASSAIFTLAFTINVIKAQIPTISPSVTPIAQIAAAISAILFYFAFIPPRWLRRAWQMEEVYAYLLRGRTSPPGDAFVSKSFQQLSQGAMRATNGIASGVLKLDALLNKWDILTASESILFANLLQNGRPLVERAYQPRKSMSIYVPDMLDPTERHALQTLGVQTWLFVPIQSQKRYWGMLVIALKERSLFIDDDLRLLELMVRECVLVLDNQSLIDELQDYSEQLEEKIEERTQALRRSNEELRQYAYVASHDLQEPLRTVTSYLQLIEMRFPERLDSDGREFIAFAVDGAMRMKNLIDDLLMYSRVDRRECKFILMDVQKVLDTTQKFLEAAINESSAQITHDPLPQIVADEELMLQLFQNLIGNAIKYRSEKIPEIHIGVACKDDEWIFSFRDNGIGIEQEFLERIFIMFQRLHTRDHYEGTGIGLAVCKKAAERHNGRIWAESTLGQGSTFHFTIPVRMIATNASVA